MDRIGVVHNTPTTTTKAINNSMIESYCNIKTYRPHADDGRVSVKSSSSTTQRTRMACSLLVLFSLLAVRTFASAAVETDAQSTSYGVDVSFPIHHRVASNYPWLPHNVHPDTFQPPAGLQDSPLQPLGDRQALFSQHLQDCRTHYQEDAFMCDTFEEYRMLMNQRQPQSMKNYTRVGFEKIRAPDTVVQLVQDFWQQNQHKAVPEVWTAGNHFINHWDAPTELVSIDDRHLRGSGPTLKEHIWAAASATLEEWTSQELEPCSMYGIRVYHDGAIMLPHVDRLPLVASAMINVAQQTEQPWPFELYDHDGVAHNVTLDPGDMLLFESHSVIHGHPFPLKGRYFAMLFMHFEPTGNTLLHDKTGFHRVDEQYHDSVKEGKGGASSVSDGLLPPYIQRQSPEEANWLKQHPEGWTPPYELLPPEAHVAAKAGEYEKLEEELKEGNSKEILTERDQNGWQVLHQGVTSGSADVVELLVDHGADINARTRGGYGDTPLRIAEKLYDEFHPIVEYLKNMGALSIGPEL